MIGLLTIACIALLALRKKRGVSGIGRNWYGGNSGYDGYSMSVRAREAREDGRFPKTDFKREYGMNDKVLTALVDLGVISNNEWHHTSKYGNKTKFYYWLDDADVDIFNENKKQIQTAIRNHQYQILADLFGVDYNDYGTGDIKVGDILRHEGQGVVIDDAVVIDVTPRYIIIEGTRRMGEYEDVVRDIIDRYTIHNWWKKVV